MVNEIPLSLFSIFLIVQLILVFYTIFTLKSDVPHIFSSSLGAYLGYLNANMILNENVVLVAATTTASSYIPIQSLPVHYILMGLAIVSALLCGYLVIDFVKSIFEKEEDEFSLGGLT